WKANNDLWLITFPEEDGEGEIVIEQLLEATAEIPYAWWGRTYAWSPDGNFLAYAQADGIGILSPDVGQPIPLVRFAPYRTQSSWAWVPGLSWSPDSYLLAYVAHEADPEGADPEESQVFGLWVASIDGTLKLRLAEEVGMWAGPRWSPVLDGLLAFGQAQTPNNSQDSRYDLYVMDRDGSNMRHLFPEEGMLGLIAPEVAWSPEGDSLILEYEGDLYRIDIRSEQVDQLTSDGQSTHPRWAR
ncbi:MAG: hypothetical protein PVG54_09545, partial [Anaerolineae bacterium]